MDISSFLQAKTEMTQATSHAGPVVLSTRVRLARNLSTYPFPKKANLQQKKDVLKTCEEALSQTPTLKKDKGTCLHLDQLEDLPKQLLVERHLISPEMAGEAHGSGVFINTSQSISVMINEEDHLRIQVLRLGFQFHKTWETADTLDTELESFLPYAFSTTLGYLTSCPTNLGTAMRASIMMHLPGLMLSEQMEKIIRALTQLGITVRGLFGEGSEAKGSIFQISNQQTLGESETMVIERLSTILQSIIEQELHARQKLLNTDKIKIFDRIGRAFGVLKNAYAITSVEAMNVLSLIRLAIDLGLIEGSYRPCVDRLFIDIQPGHIQASSKGSLSGEKRDSLRAQYLRQAFGTLLSLNFDSLASS